MKLSYRTLLRNEAVSRSSQSVLENFRIGFPVNRQRKSLTDLLVLENFVLTVKHKHDGTGCGVRLLHQFSSLAEFVDVVGIRDVQVIQRAVFQRRKLGGGVVHNQIVEMLQFDIVRIPIGIVFHKGKLAVVDPLGQGEWAAADDAFRICAQCVAILVDVILSLREEIDGGKQRWRRLREGNFQRAVIDDFHADFGWIHFSCNRLREIDNCRIVAGKSKCIGRSCLTDQSAGVILGGDLLTITPVVLPQMEGVNQTVI